MCSLTWMQTSEPTKPRYHIDPCALCLFPLQKSQGCQKVLGGYQKVVPPPPPPLVIRAVLKVHSCDYQRIQKNWFWCNHSCQKKPNEVIGWVMGRFRRKKKAKRLPSFFSFFSPFFFSPLAIYWPYLTLTPPTYWPTNLTYLLTKLGAPLLCPSSFSWFFFILLLLLAPSSS